MTEWPRPTLKTSTPVRVWLAGGLAGVVVTASALGAMHAVLDAPMPVVMPTPTVTVQAAAAIVTVPAAPVVMIAPMQEAAAAPVEAVPTIVPPRALAPHLDERCVIGRESATVAPCQWDDGFPAIAADGSLIAVKWMLDDGGRGYPNLAIAFIDPVTSRVVSRVTILDADEYDEENPDDPRLARKVAKRARAVQRALDTGRYRSLETVTTLDPEREAELQDEAAPRPSKPFAEIQANTLRIVDPMANTVLWQGDVGVAPPRTALEECSGWSRLETEASYDRVMGVLLVGHVFRTGGCLCSDESRVVVRRTPAGLALR